MNPQFRPYFPFIMLFGVIFGVALFGELIAIISVTEPLFMISFAVMAISSLSMTFLYNKFNSDSAPGHIKLWKNKVFFISLIVNMIVVIIGIFLYLIFIFKKCPKNQTYDDTLGMCIANTSNTSM